MASPRATAHAHHLGVRARTIRAHPRARQVRKALDRFLGAGPKARPSLPSILPLTIQPILSDVLNYVSQNPSRPWLSGGVSGSSDWIRPGHTGGLGHYGGDRHPGGESSGLVGPGSRGEGETNLSGVLSDCRDPGRRLGDFGGLGGELCAVQRPELGGWMMCGGQ